MKCLRCGADIPPVESRAILSAYSMLCSECLAWLPWDSGKVRIHDPRREEGPDGAETDAAKSAAPPDIRAALRYRHDGLEIIRAVKFACDRRYLRIWVVLLIVLLDDISAARAGTLQPDLAAERLVLVPIPSSASGLFHRGWDPVARAARLAASMLDIRFWPCLSSNRGKSQKFLNLTQRSRDHGLSLDLQTPVEGRNQSATEGAASFTPSRSDTIVLFDDVVTTGATLGGAMAILRDAGFGNVYGAALAAD